MHKCLNAEDFHEAFQLHGKMQQQTMQKILLGEEEMPSGHFEMPAVSILDYRGEKFWVGAIVRIRDMRKVFELKGSSDKMELSVRSLEKNTRPAEINFFVMKEATCKGLYLHYYGSTSLNDFCRIASRAYSERLCVLREEMKTALLESGEAKSEASAIRKSSSKYPLKGSFKWEPIVSDKRLHELVSKLQKIETIEVSFDTEPLIDQPFRILRNGSRRIRHNFTISDSRKNSKLFRLKVAALCKKDRLGDARIKGIDAEGLHAIYSLRGNLDKFAEFEMEDIMEDISLDFTSLVTSVEKSTTIEKLLKVSSLSHVTPKLA